MDVAQMAPPTSISLSANGVDARTFAALANLLSLRSGGQLELSVELEGVVDEDEEADMSDFDDDDTIHPAQIANTT